MGKRPPGLVAGTHRRVGLFGFSKPGVPAVAVSAWYELDEAKLDPVFGNS